MTQHHYRAIATLLMVCATLRVSTAAPPLAFVDTWLVTQVAADRQDPQNGVFKPQDPRLLNRVMTVGSDGRLDFNLTTEACSLVTWAPQPPSRLSALVAKTFPRGPRGSGRKAPTLADFDLKFADSTVKPYVALCLADPAARDKPASWGNAAWFTMLDAARMGVAYDSDTVLVLERIPAGTPVRPSFACAGAKSPTEAAICGSQALAGYDRSIADLYPRVLQKADARTRPAIEQEQQAWLKTRDACKADNVCIANSMADRLGLLMQE